MGRTSRAIAFATAAVVLGTGACGTDQPEKPAVCESLAAVQDNLTRIRNVTVAENGLTQFKTDLAQLKVNLQQLATDAKAEFATELQPVQAAANQLSASVDTARATPDATNLSGVRTSLNVLASSVQEFGDGLSGTC